MSAGRIWVLTVLVLAAPSLVAAETSGGLRGIVTDEAGAPLPGAVVVARNDGHGIQPRGATTGPDGSFTLAALPPAVDYDVTVSLPNYATVTLHEVDIPAGRVTTLPVVLQPQSGLREKVEVVARPRPIDLQDTTTQTRLGSELIESLPILGRDYQDALTLAPGVTDIDGDGNPNIHGARDTDVVTLVDGVSTTDPLTGKIGAQLNIESIQEIEIKTSGADAEYGRAQGGFVNIVTKSGGNEFRATLKAYWRGSRLDGDGAGTDDPILHGGVGDIGTRDLRFNDILGFLSFEGPIRRDRAWFFATSEYIQTEDPINALNTAFLAQTREFRNFLKLTWQVSPNHRLALSLNHDPQEYDNLGLNSFTRTESGYTDTLGGLVVTLRDTSVLSPNVALETSLSGFSEHPVRTPTLDPDTNGNGVLYNDYDRNGLLMAKERDPGEDYDVDGAFDVNEKFGEDVDDDGHRTPWGACEGAAREDTDCDGHLDNVREDLNGNGAWDPGETDVDGDFKPDLGTEDRNGNGVLDDTPFPTSLYPYGRLRPVPPDRDYSLDQKTGLVSGPYFLDLTDDRTRVTLRQDLSIYVPEARGSHDLKFGFSAEHEAFSREVFARSLLAPYIAPKRARCGMKVGQFERPCVSTVRVLSAVDDTTDNSASTLAGALYVQDFYKPVPNLSFGLGLRYDRESTETNGYSAVDPASERLLHDRLTELAGQGATSPSLLLDRDGMVNRGITGDPLYYGPEGLPTSFPLLRHQVQLLGLARMTRPHTAVEFDSPELLASLPEVTTNGQVDFEVLARLGIVPQQSQAFRLTNDNLAPRLSVSWDPAADGRGRVYGSWGRYYDKLFLATIVGEEGPDMTTSYYLLDEFGWDGVADAGLGRRVAKSPASVTQVDRGLRTPFVDEMTLGFEREVAPELALRIAFIDRKFRDQLQDVDINHSTRIDPLTGQLADEIGRLRFLPGTAGQNSTPTPFPDGRPDLYIHNFFFNQILAIGNFNEARYRGIEVELRRRLARRWEMLASYTYSRATGAAEDFQSTLGNDPSTVEAEFGYLDYDQRHVVKVNASIYLPHDWQLGAAASWSSGLPYSVITRFFAIDDANYMQFRTRYGVTVPDDNGGHFVAVRRNSERNAAVLDVNLRVRKAFVLGRQSGAFFAEVFNVLNRDELRILSYQPSETDTSSIDDQTPLSRLQIDGTRRFGRRIQLGFQFDF